MMRRACYFPTDLPLTEALQNSIRAAGFECDAWPGEDHAAPVDAVLLLTPVWCSNNEAVHSEGVWRRYLADRHPEAKLILTGLRRDLAGANYIHWLHPPDDFRTFVENAIPVQEQVLPQPLGSNMEAVWKRLIDGHDKGGFSYYFTWGKLPVLIAWDNLNGHSEKAEAQREYLLEAGAASMLSHARARWKMYQPYWEASPMGQVIGQVEAHTPYFDTHTQWAADADQLLEQLTILREHILEVERIIEAVAKYFKE